MKKVFLFFWAAFFTCFLFNSCQDVGLGEALDLEAPVITIKKLESGDYEPLPDLVGGVYCKKDVRFSGTATDNNKVTRVYAELKWSTESDFSYLKDADLNGTSWTLDYNFEKEGSCFIKFTAEDKAKNVSSKTSKTITLFVDSTAPVANAWYIDRELNGIQFNLKSKEDLQAIDLTLPENKDAAQNVSFTICATATDTYGIKDISINLKDEDGKTITTIENSNEGNPYAPKFKVTHDLLVKNKPSLASGKHYLKISYNSEDVITYPDSNSTTDEEVEIGYFIWWPEMDEPQITNSDLKVDSDTNEELLSAHVQDSLSFYFFDDDAILEGYFALLTAEEFSAFNLNWDTLKENPELLKNAVKADSKNGEDSDEEARANRFCYFKAEAERDTTIILKAAKESQTMHFVGLGWDNTDAKKCATKDFAVTVTDESTPMLLISSPKNNSVPKFNEGTNKTTISGQTLDSSGCTYLEFAWVPNATEDKYNVAKAVLEIIKTESDHNKYKNKKVSTSELIVWGVELSSAGEPQNSFYKQSFNFDVDLIDDFKTSSGSNEKTKEKYFLAKLTRKDGNVIYQEYKLAADNESPTIVGVTPATDMQVVQDSEDVTLKFYAVKNSGLKIDTGSYSITRVDKTPEQKLTGSYNSTSGFYEATVTSAELSEMQGNGERPRYKFYAKDIFGTESYTEYTLVISELPILKSITSSASQNCKLGDEINIVATFSKTVGVQGNPYIKIKGITNSSSGITSSTAVPAYYTSGSGTTSIQFTYTVKEGDECTSGLTLYNTLPIEDNNSLSFTSDKVVISPVSTAENASPKNNFDAKKITIDAISPAVSAKNFSYTGGQVVDGVTYLKEGSSITATLTLSEKVIVSSPTPAIVLIADGTSSKKIELPFTSFTDSGTKLIFSKTISASDANGSLTYSAASYVQNASSIADTYGNALSLSKTDSSESLKAHVDTVAPAKPTVKATDYNGSTITLTDGAKYKGKIDFVLNKTQSDGTIRYLQYSLNGGSTWLPNEATAEGKTNTLSESASFTYRAVDNAGNVSEIPEPIYLDIESAFPSYSVECISSDGNYAAGKTLTFRVSFARNVNIPAGSGAYITVSGANSSDVGGGKAPLTSNTAKSNVEYADFTYKVTSSDDFIVKVATDAVTLTGITDEYGFTQGNKALDEAYTRSGIHCDGVVPSVKNMTDTDSSSGTVFTKGNEIVLTFSEPVLKSSGNITLRRAGTWAIPPVLTATEFNKICNAITSEQKDILSLQEQENGSDMEDSEWVNGSAIANYKNQYYHGTGQFVGPYKKMTQGILASGEPDITTKYVLAFDMDIWDTNTTTHYFGKTFTSSTQVAPTEPTEKRTVSQLRQVLEAAHYHERILDVTSSDVKTSADGKSVTIKFPAGLCDTSASLPSGIEWELVIDEGAFMDYTGNNMASYTSSTFFSSGVQTPVIRVDRYSYGQGIYQSSATGTTSLISGDSTKPTGYVRTRIDCQTPNVTIKYNVSTSNTATSYTTSGTVNDVYSRIYKAPAITTATLSGITPSTSYTKNSIFASGSGNYKTACRQYIVASATHSTLGTSQKGYEGVFQTVTRIIDPRQNNTSDYEIYQMNDTYDDFSIRGTTGWSGEPYISPFPLRDAQIGSPYLRLCYKAKADSSNTGDARKDYYWLSYEILVDSSISGTARDNNNWEYISGWGYIVPGGYSDTYNMHTW